MQSLLIGCRPLPGMEWDQGHYLAREVSSQMKSAEGARAILNIVPCTPGCTNRYEPEFLMKPIIIFITTCRYLFQDGQGLSLIVSGVLLETCWGIWAFLSLFTFTCVIWVWNSAMCHIRCDVPIYVIFTHIRTDMGRQPNLGVRSNTHKHWTLYIRW